MQGSGMTVFKQAWAFATVSLCLFAVIAPAMAIDPSLPESHASREVRVFDVLRDGDSIGKHRIELVRQDGRTEVLVDVKLEVGLGPIVLYRYEQTNREVWQDGRFVSFHSVTNDDGDDWNVEADAGQNGITVSVNGGSPELVPARVATTYWNKATVEQPLLVGTQEGKPLSVTSTRVGTQRIVAEGREIDAMKYEMRGDLDIDLWYDENGRWVKLAFEYEGSQFDYVLLPPEYIETWTAKATTALSGSPALAQESEKD